VQLCNFGRNLRQVFRRELIIGEVFAFHAAVFQRLDKHLQSLRRQQRR